MDKDLEAVCAQLETISKAVLAATQDNRTLLEWFGWNCPALTRHDLAGIPKRLAKRLRELAPDSIEEPLLARIRGLTTQLAGVHSTTVPYLFNGNGAQASAAYIGTFNSIAQILDPLLSWQDVDEGALPAKLARKLTAIRADLEQIAPKKAELSSQIDAIRSAAEAADALPIDLQNLAEARLKVSTIASDAEGQIVKIRARLEESTSSSEAIKDFRIEAEKLVANCEEAYRITTTKGLAASFQERADALGRSVRYWVALLIVTLGAGATLGYLRIHVITAALNAQEPKVGFIWLQLALSALSVGAPLWAAWIATKQLGQRFRLAEDYSFKASVARAYEGYRKEAARLDQKFEAELFSSALKRLDEEPLRLVERSNHGSPWSEMLSSPTVIKALDLLPDSKDQIMQIVKRAVEHAKTGQEKPVDNAEK